MDYNEVVIVDLKKSPDYNTDDIGNTMPYNDIKFVQTPSCIENMVAVQPYGRLIIPLDAERTDMNADITLAINVYDQMPSYNAARKFMTYECHTTVEELAIGLNPGDSLEFVRT